ncbi:MAG: AsmA family protein [Gammaproteobacteria bacterium]|nr:AsmA family protein [Gammaproteobacteria bacterium]
MTRGASIALYSLLGVLTLLAICIVVILSLDFGRFQGYLEETVTELLDRDFAIEGDFVVEVDLRRIRVSASEVRLAGAEWGAAPELARIGRFDTSIATLSLLNGPLRIETLDVERVRVDLEQDDTGRSNWDLFAPEDTAPDEDVEGPPGDLPVIVESARVVGVALTYDNPERPQPLSFNVFELAVERDDQDYLDLHLDAALNDTPVGLDMTAGTVANLVGYRDVTVDLAGNLGEIKLEGQATIDSLLEPRRPTLQLAVSGPSVEYLTEKLQVEQITSGPLKLTAAITPLGDDMQLNLNGDIGEFALDASGQFQNLQELDDVSLRVAASGPDAGTIARLLGNPDVPQDPFSVVASFTRVGPTISVKEFAVNVGKTRFIVNAEISDIEKPAGASVGIRIDGPNFGRFNRLLGMPGKLSGPFDLTLDLEPQPDGSATVNMAANAEDVKFTIAGTVANTEDLSGSKFRVDFSGPDLRTITDALGHASAPSRAFELGADLERIVNGVSLANGALLLGDDRASFGGLIGNAPLEADTDVTFEVQGPDFGGTLTAFGVDADELPRARYRAAGRVERGAEGFILHDIGAAIGDQLEYELRVTGSVADHPDLVGTRLQVRAHGESLGALTDAVGVAGIPDLPFQAEASLERVAEGFAIENGRASLGQDSLAVSGLVGEKPLERDTSLRFDVVAADLNRTLASFGVDIDALPPGKFVTGGEIRSRGNQFQLRGINASLAGARASLSGQLGAMPTLVGTDVTLEIQGDDLASLLPEDDNLAKLNKPFRVAARVQMARDMLSVSGVEIRLPGLDATATVDVGMAPTMGRGRFTIEATSPDLVPLVPAEYAVLQVDKVPLRLQTSGRWDDKRWTLEELDLLLARGTLVGAGTVGGPPEFSGTDLTLDLNVASLSTLSALAGRKLPDDPAQLKFHLVESGGLVKLERFDGSFGDSDIAGHFALRVGDVPEIEVALRSNRLNLEPYLPEDTDSADAEEAQPAEPADRVIPDTPIPMESLKKVAASVDIDIKEIDVGPKEFTDIVLRGTLADGALAVERFALSNNVGGSLGGTFTLRPMGDAAALSLDVAGSELILGMPADTAEELAGLPRYELDTILVGRGATVREMAASLNGYLRLVGGEGRLRASALRFFTGDFLSEVLNTVNPFAQTDPYTNFTCAVILAEIENGQASGDPVLVAQTDRLRILADAEANLATEEFSASIRTVPQKGLGLSVGDLVNPYIKLGGTFADPSLTLDPEGVLIEGGTAVATGGISILAKRFKQRFLDDKDACGKALTDAAPRFAELREKYRPAQE